MTGQPIPSWYDDLDGSLDEAWRLISRGVKDRRSPFHTPTVATRGLDGSPSVRTVVLRAASRADGFVRFHTDQRSSKVAELDADNRLAIHFYDPGSKVQVRLSGRATVHRDTAMAQEAWVATRLFSRECYRVTKAPGANVDDPAAVVFDAPGADGEGGRDAFCAVVLSVESLEWLYLAAQGHRRARFLRDTDATWYGNWLVP